MGKIEELSPIIANATITMEAIEHNQLFDGLENVLKQLSVPIDADHRTAGKCKRSLNLFSERLTTIKRMLDEKQQAAQATLDRIRSELEELDPITKLDNTKLKTVSVGSVPRGGSISPEPILPTATKTSASGEWLSRVNGRVVSLDRAAVKSMDEFPIAHKFSYPFRVINKREDCFKYPGQLCWLGPRNLPLVAVGGVILSASIPKRFALGTKEHVVKVLAHRDPESVEHPNQDDYYVDPLRNQRSSDTGNLMANTIVSPVTADEAGGRYAVRVGGYDTIGADLSVCSLEQLEYAFRFYSGGLMTAILIAEAIQRRKR